MKIGFFTDTYFPQISGVATSIKTLKEELEKNGHEVVIFTTTDPNASDEEQDVVRMPSIPFVSFKDRRIVVSGMLEAYGIAKDLELDIIHTHTEFGAGWLGKHTAKHLDIPVVHTYHTMYEDYLHYIANGKLIRPTHVRQASRTFCRQLSGIICPSERVVQKLQQYQIYAPMAVIPTGVDVEKFEKHGEAVDGFSIRKEYNIDADELLLLSLSRISYEKNIQTIIEGMPTIIKEIPQVKLLVVGDGPYVEELQSQAEALNISSYIVFTGEISNADVGRFYRQADYFVSASDSESQGLTYIESIAAGTKVVAKGNEYLDHLLDSKVLGVTYRNNEDFGQAFLHYYNELSEDDDAIRKQKLYEISSKNFGLKVETFYQEAIKYHDNFILGSFYDKNSLSLKLFKKKE